MRAKSSGKSRGGTCVQGPWSDSALNHRPEINTYAWLPFESKKSWLSVSAAYFNDVPRIGLKSGSPPVINSSAGCVRTMIRGKGAAPGVGAPAVEADASAATLLGGACETDQGPWIDPAANHVPPPSR